jgi:hypothetical protein
VSTVATYSGNVTAQIRGRVISVPGRTPGAPMRHLVAIAAIYVPTSDKTHAALVPIEPSETRIEMRFGEPYLTDEAMTERFESEPAGTIEGAVIARASGATTDANPASEELAERMKAGQIGTAQIAADQIMPGATIEAETVTVDRIAAGAIRAAMLTAKRAATDRGDDATDTR